MVVLGEVGAMVDLAVLGATEVVVVRGDTVVLTEVLTVVLPVPTAIRGVTDLEDHTDTCGEIPMKMTVDLMTLTKTASKNMIQTMIGTANLVKDLCKWLLTDNIVHTTRARARVCGELIIIIKKKIDNNFRITGVHPRFLNDDQTIVILFVVYDNFENEYALSLPVTGIPRYFTNYSFTVRAIKIMICSLIDWIIISINNSGACYYTKKHDVIDTFRKLSKKVTIFLTSLSQFKEFKCQYNNNIYAYEFPIYRLCCKRHDHR